MIETRAACFEKHFGSKRPRFARAPGRVNLIGEHTDYNDGFVLPVAIDRYVTVAYASNPDNVSTLCGYSIDFEQSCSAAYGELGSVSSAPSWFDYAAGMAWALGREKAALPGRDFVVAGNVPIGAGLSSSAALELAMARALFDASGTHWDGRLAARLGQRVENEYIGLESGIMDQMASSLSECGAAMLLDCRDLTIETVPLPEELTVVVLDTGTRRELATSAYNERRASCEAAVAAVRRQAASTRALRDVSVELLDAAWSTMDETTYRRALHVIRENERTLEMGAGAPPRRHRKPRCVDGGLSREFARALRGLEPGARSCGRACSKPSGLPWGPDDRSRVRRLRGGARRHGTRKLLCCRTAGCDFGALHVSSGLGSGDSR